MSWTREHDSKVLQASAASADAAQSSHAPSAASAAPLETGLAAGRRESRDSSTDASQASQGGAVLAGLLGRFGFFQQGDANRGSGPGAHTDPVSAPITILQRPEVAPVHQQAAQLPAPQPPALPPTSLLVDTGTAIRLPRPGLHALP